MRIRSLIQVAVCIVLLTPMLHAGQPLTDAERAELLAHLDRTEGLLADAVEGLTAEQWNYKPGPDRWSISENVEHLILTESMLRGMTEKAMAEPASAERLANARKEDQLLPMVVDRSNKVKTFEPLEPTGQWPMQAQAMEKFLSERDATRTMAESGGDLRAFVGDHPILKELDAYGFLMFISGHTERHVLQIEEVKSSDGYPQ